MESVLLNNNTNQNLLSALYIDCKTQGSSRKQAICSVVTFEEIFFKDKAMYKERLSELTRNI
jgi:hypothetical protein